MSESAVELGIVLDADGSEWFIPPCVKEMRVASDAQLTTRNPDFRGRRDGDFELASYENGGDGDMIVTCRGKADCEGGKVRVDRHDLLQAKLPLTTAALGSLCTSRQKFVSRGGFVKPHEDLDVPEPLQT